MEGYLLKEKSVLTKTSKPHNNLMHFCTIAIWLLHSFMSIKDNILSQNRNGKFSENQCRLCTSSLVKNCQLPHCVIEWFYYLINYHTLNCSLKGTNWIAPDVSLSQALIFVSGCNGLEPTVKWNTWDGGSY